MKYLDKTLDKVDKQNKLIEVWLDKMIVEFLIDQIHITDTNELLDVFDCATNINVIILNDNDKTYFQKINGELKEKNIPNSASAFNAISEGDDRKEVWEVKNGVFLKEDTFTNLRTQTKMQKVIHELFHALSTKETIEASTEGKKYSKVGVYINGYTENNMNEIVDVSLAAKGINEGVTEMLACRFYNNFYKTNVAKPQCYEIQAYLADIMMSDFLNTNASLVYAYFNEDEMVFKKFLREFDFAQGNDIDEFSSIDLVELTNGANQTDETICRALKATLNYTMKYTLDYENEIERLEKIRSEMLECPNICDSVDCELATRINEIFNEFFHESERTNADE